MKLIAWFLGKRNMADEPKLYTEYGKRLRRMADVETDPDRARELRLLASELELAFDKQNNIYGSAAMRLDDKLEEVVHEQRRFMSDWDKRGAGVDTFLMSQKDRDKDLKSSIDHAHQAISDQNTLITAGFEGVSADLGKLWTEQEAQGVRLGTVEDTQQELKEGQASLAGQMSNLSEEVNTHAERIGAVEERVASLEARVGSMEGEVARVVQAVDGNQRLLERWSRTQPPPTELRDDAT